MLGQGARGVKQAGVVGEAKAKAKIMTGGPCAATVVLATHTHMNLHIHTLICPTFACTHTVTLAHTIMPAVRSTYLRYAHMHIQKLS